MGHVDRVPRFSMLFAFFVSLVVIFLTVRCSQVEKQWLVVLGFSVVSLLGSRLGLRLRLVVEQQVGRVVPSAVGHHHRANGAGVDVLDLEESLDHVDIFRLDVLERQTANCLYFIYKSTFNLRT